MWRRILRRIRQRLPLRLSHLKDSATPFIIVTERSNWSSVKSEHPVYAISALLCLGDSEQLVQRSNVIDVPFRVFGAFFVGEFAIDDIADHFLEVFGITLHPDVAIGF